MREYNFPTNATRLTNPFKIPFERNFKRICYSLVSTFILKEREPLDKIMEKRLRKHPLWGDPNLTFHYGEGKFLVKTTIIGFVR